MPRATDRINCVVVVSGGGEPVGDVRALVQPGAVLLAADSGVDTARALGLRVDVVVGDLDSASPEALAWAAESGATVERHPEVKDATDLELALDRAMSMRPARIVVLGGEEGRLDHLVATLLLLGAPRFAGPVLEARIGRAHVTVVRPGQPARLYGRRGDLVTLVPLHGPAIEVTTVGLLYPLRGEDLLAGSSRGVSNELAPASQGEAASVEVRGGVLAVIQPGIPGEHIAHGVSPG